MTTTTVTTTPRLYMTTANRVARLDGEDIDRVTNILNALAKPALTQWAADQAADYAIDNWADLTELPTSKRLTAIRYAHRTAMTKAATRGTTIHGYGEQLVHGVEVEIPEDLRGPVEAYARHLDRWEIVPVAAETPVANTQHRYGGRADLWATIGARDMAKALIDIKTGSGVYAEVALQLAAYRHCDLWQPAGPESEQPLPEVDLVYVAHVGVDDVRMVPVTAGPAEWRAFLYIQQTSQWLKHHGFKGPEPLIGEAETP